MFEKGVLDELRMKKIPHIMIANKMGVPGATMDNLRDDVDMNTPILPVSAATGSGVDELEELIVAMVDRCN